MAFPDENDLVYEISSLKEGTFHKTKNFKFLKMLILMDNLACFYENILQGITYKKIHKIFIFLIF